MRHHFWRYFQNIYLASQNSILSFNNLFYFQILKYFPFQNLIFYVIIAFDVYYQISYQFLQKPYVTIKETKL